MPFTQTTAAYCGIPWACAEYQHADGSSKKYRQRWTNTCTIFHMPHFRQSTTARVLATFNWDHVMTLSFFSGGSDNTATVPRRGRSFLKVLIYCLAIYATNRTQMPWRDSIINNLFKSVVFTSCTKKYLLVLILLPTSNVRLMSRVDQCWMRFDLLCHLNFRATQNRKPLKPRRKKLSYSSWLMCIYWNVFRG